MAAFNWVVAVRVFQAVHATRSYQHDAVRRLGTGGTFVDRIGRTIADLYGGCHILLPVLEGSPDAFYTIGNDQTLQGAWAMEHGLATTTTLEDILLAQIEDHRTEVFYCLDPVTFDSRFLKRLPGCVRATVCWRAAPTPASVDLSGYDLRVNNFPNLQVDWLAKGWRCALLDPAHDDRLDQLAANEDRPTAIGFVGGWSRHHVARNAMLGGIAALATQDRSVVLHLELSRLTRLVGLPVLRWLPLPARLPQNVAIVAQGPLYGRPMAELFSRCLIVINGAGEIAGRRRGNMRCFEAMGCGTAMLSDAGEYPCGMDPGENLLTYDRPEDAARVALQALADPGHCREIGRRGHTSISVNYTRQRQWKTFCSLVEPLL